MEDSKFLLFLFISGMSERSTQAIEMLHSICDNHLAGKCDIKIIDIGVSAQLAITHDIIATPTLLRVSPGDKKKITGDVSLEKILNILDLKNIND
ncbi:MAG: circadian clock protein KaiB [Bacteroidetes bacterium]|nr:circadian clock protein KaiB [Bacteroidota bacterium]